MTDTPVLVEMIAADVATVVRHFGWGRRRDAALRRDAPDSLAPGLRGRPLR